MCTIKGDDFISLSRDVLVASASMMPEPRRRGHMAIVALSISGQFFISWVARESPTTFDS
jgi:hypothetical protein